MSTKIKFASTLLLACVLLLLPSPGLADIAPPQMPPGSNPEPGSEGTQVRMAAETVVLSIIERPPAGSLGQAAVTATFQMENLGSVEERLQVRFPLSDPSGYTDWVDDFPEIEDIRVKVNGANVPTSRITTENPSRSFDNPIPWAAFEAAFPAGEIVEIEVSYTQDGYGEFPYITFRYLLETGAGWAGTIGSADLIVRLPYEANRQNTIFDSTIGWGESDPGAEIEGNELHWRYEDFEPTSEHNLDVTVVMPEAWNKVLVERENVSRSPEDGEAWGRLGKAAKEASRVRRGYREDEGGLQLYEESVRAYERCVSLLPEDALWHFGFAELLWNHYYFHEYSFAQEAHDQTELVRALEELRLALEFDPGNERAATLLEEISYSIPQAVQMEGEDFALLALTATPDYPTPLPPLVIAEDTATPEPTATVEPTAEPTMTAEEPLPTTEAEQPTTEAAEPTREPADTPIAAAPEPEARKGTSCFGSAILPVLLFVLPLRWRLRGR